MRRLVLARDRIARVLREFDLPSAGREQERTADLCRRIRQSMPTNADARRR